MPDSQNTQDYIKQVANQIERLEMSEDMATHILLGRNQLDFLKNVYSENCPPKGEEDEYIMRWWGIEIVPVDRENFLKLVREINLIGK